MVHNIKELMILKESIDKKSTYITCKAKTIWGWLYMILKRYQSTYLNNPIII